MNSECYFDLDGDTYRGRDPARGPWSEDHCHAGPVAGAVARSVETALGPGKRLVRLTIDLIRPVPVAGFTVAVDIIRNGKRLATANAVLAGLDGRTAASATAMLIAPAPGTAIDAGPGPRPVLAEATPGRFAITQARHERPYFGQFVETRYPPGEDSGPGPTRMWMRAPRLIANEEPSSFQRLCPLADCGNAIGRNGEVSEFHFLNTDLTIVAHRTTGSEWLLSEAHTQWHADGLGMSQAVLCDEEGPIATALQSLIIGRH